MVKYQSQPGTYPFRIEYPQGWHVDDAQQGQVVFYQDDEDEGSSFVLVPYGGLQGELSARDVLQVIGQQVQQRYPDIQIKVLGARTTPVGNAQMQILDAEATWTGTRQQRMRALLQVRALTYPGTGSTLFTYLGGQAPAQAFDALRPVFVRMIKTFVI